MLEYRMNPRLSFAFLTVSGACILASYSQAANANTTAYIAKAIDHASALNASGQIVGQAPDSDAWGADWHSFMTGANASGLNNLGHFSGPSSSATAINANGFVTGFTYNIATGEKGSAFVTGAGGVGVSYLSTLGGSGSLPFAINDAGRVVGSSDLAGNLASHAFISGSFGGGMTDLGTLGGDYSSATGINATSQVVGSSAIKDDMAYHAFMTGANGLGMVDLGTFGGSNSYANGINAHGQVVGSADIAGDAQSHAFITDAHGVKIDLGTLNGTSSYGMAINASAQVVGNAFVDSDDLTPRAFVTRANGVGMVDLNTLVTLDGGALLYNAFAINDAGQILATATNGTTYFLTPVPEPDVLAMTLSGLFCTGAMLRRRQRGASA
jgi:probable HAF family extracellular repeat protein